MLFETATITYTAEKEIGQGGAGTVFRVLDGEGYPYALKRLNATTSLKRRRFKNELSFCQQEQHRNIIRVVDAGLVLGGPNEPLPFYVMPVYDCTLRTLINEGIQHDRVLPLFDQVASGVEAAHLKGVFHRDLKPENILYDRRADCLVVADFGVAHFEEDSSSQQLRLRITSGREFRIRRARGARSRPSRRSACRYLRSWPFLNEMFTQAASSAPGHPRIASIVPSYGYLDDLAEKMILHAPADRPPSLRDVKEELLRRGNEFVALQRLDAARRAVVPAFSPDDPLHGQDVEITGDFDYDPQPGLLKVGLKPTPPETWWRALGQIGEFPYMASAHPQNVGFTNGKA